MVFTNYMSYVKYISSAKCAVYHNTYIKNRVFSSFAISTSSKDGAEIFWNLLPLLVKVLLLFCFSLGLLVKDFASPRV